MSHSNLISQRERGGKSVSLSLSERRHKCHFLTLMWTFFSREKSASQDEVRQREEIVSVPVSEGFDLGHFKASKKVAPPSPHLSIYSKREPPPGGEMGCLPHILPSFCVHVIVSFCSERNRCQRSAAFPLGGFQSVR